MNIVLARVREYRRETGVRGVRASLARALAPAAIGFTCAVATGLVFGLPPAMKAARLGPVVALASE